MRNSEFLCRVTNLPIHKLCRGTAVDKIDERACASCLEEEKQFKSIAHKEATELTLFKTGSSTDFEYRFSSTDFEKKTSDEVCCNKKCPYPTVLLT